MASEDFAQMAKNLMNRITLVMALEMRAAAKLRVANAEEYFASTVEVAKEFRDIALKLNELAPKQPSSQDHSEDAMKLMQELALLNDMSSTSHAERVVFQLIHMKNKLEEARDDLKTLEKTLAEVININDSESMEGEVSFESHESEGSELFAGGSALDLLVGLLLKFVIIDSN